MGERGGECEDRAVQGSGTCAGWKARRIQVHDCWVLIQARGWVLVKARGGEDLRSASHIRAGEEICSFRSCGIRKPNK